MNLLVVVEGEVGEKRVYEKWIPLVNPRLTLVNHSSEISNNNFEIIAGYGYPNYFKVIEDAVEDVNNFNNIDRLVIAIDSEEMSFKEKYDEVFDFLKDKPCLATIHIIIQHFCLETWALGNKRIGPRNPKGAELRFYKNFYNVLRDDPELLPGYPPEELTRVKFAEKYLRAMLNDKHKNLTYSKRNPKALLHNSYFYEINNRLKTTGHIDSFSTFLRAFEE
jgi:hypothetical protein